MRFTGKLLNAGVLIDDNVRGILDEGVGLLLHNGDCKMNYAVDTYQLEIQFSDGTTSAIDFWFAHPKNAGMTVFALQNAPTLLDEDRR